MRARDLMLAAIVIIAIIAVSWIFAWAAYTNRDGQRACAAKFGIEAQYDGPGKCAIKKELNL